MGLSDYGLILWFIAGTAGVVATFWVFGLELAAYLFLGVVGFFLYTNAELPTLQIIGGWLGVVCGILFITGLIYYVTSQLFFPSNHFEFKFLTVVINFLNGVSNNIGKFVLNLVSRKP